MEILGHLRAISFFEHLNPQEFEALAAHFTLRKYVGGDDILKQGQQSDHFFIVETGAVNLRHTDRSGLEQPVGSKGPGEYFGIKMFTTQEPADYTFEAVNAASLWVLEREKWDQVLGANPEILDHMPELRREFERLTRGLDWLSPGEVILLMQRRHWWALFLMIRLPLAVAVIFTIAFLISLSMQITARLEWVLPVYAAAIGVCLVWAGWNALNWLNDVYIVTNKRVVRIDKVVFFSESREELAIEKIQSQKVERGGPISVLLNISNLRITSASSDALGVQFDQVGNVAKIQRLISDEQTRLLERKSATEREKLRSQITSEIRHYVFQQPGAPEPAKVESPVRRRSPLLQPLQRLTRRRPNPAIKPKIQAKPVALQKQVADTWVSLFGTEMRQGKVVTWRKDYFVLLQQVGLYLGILVGLTALAIGISVIGDSGTFFNNGVYAAIGLMMLAAFLGVTWEWLDWRVDLYRLTEKEIIDIESLPFGLRYQENKADLNKIQDVTYQRQGFINTLLDYGNVITRVAGNAQPFSFIAVTHPRLVADEISERIEVLKLRSTESSTRENTRQIVDAIVAYHRLMMAERHREASLLSTAPVIDNHPEPHPEPPPEPPRLVSAAPLIELDGEFPPEAEIR